MMEDPALRLVGRFLLLMNALDHTRLHSLPSKSLCVRQAGDLRRLITFGAR
jgi:hypothetical protein